MPQFINQISKRQKFFLGGVLNKAIYSLKKNYSLWENYTLVEQFNQDCVKHYLNLNGYILNQGLNKPKKNIYFSLLIQSLSECTREIKLFEKNIPK